MNLKRRVDIPIFFNEGTFKITSLISTYLFFLLVSSGSSGGIFLHGCIAVCLGLFRVNWVTLRICDGGCLLQVGDIIPET